MSDSFLITISPDADFKNAILSPMVIFNDSATDSISVIFFCAATFDVPIIFMIVPIYTLSNIYVLDELYILQYNMYIMVTIHIYALRTI